MERVRFIEHNGARILLLDFSDLAPEEFEEVVGVARDLVRTSTPKSLLALTKVDNGRFKSITVDALKEFAKGNEPFVREGAIVGLFGLQRLSLDAVMRFTGRDFVICKTLEEAKRLLAS